MDNSDYNIFSRAKINSMNCSNLWRNCITVEDKPDRRYKDKKVEEFKNYILLSVSTRFIRDWITSRYLDEILRIIKEFNKNINRIELKINETNTENTYLNIIE